jgi:hypothetical protein
VQSRIDARLRQEQRRFHLRFACPDCAHFDPDEFGCANGYPNSEHHSSDLSQRRVLSFCKGFELY